ncbi:MGH1-like glycoside hydrolase domain-containing protein [Dactylosporangium sp. CS-047395]|uniref:MGH1-like glycoside hydrolase domain-containing protein n=1 Tax=Dactylosporangium sp. CS-047395 TaxID=3239936 RepID=UPI003D8C3741
MIEDDGNAERRRLAEADSGERPWRGWGPYLSERAWGTVREDYSAYGNAWDYFPHDQARSRTYRWNEDGMAGICDDRQTFCFALALWNGKDSILKERMFGLGGDLGNHGEDVKEYWWYTDSTPTHSWMSWRYHYPQEAFPYDDLVAENNRRGRHDPEYELVDTGIFDEDRYWAVEVDYAKAGPTDMCVLIRVRNMGPEAAELHILPTLWFRNTWAWGLPGRDYRPEIRAKDSGLLAEHRLLGRLALTGDGKPRALFCNNETNGPRIWGKAGEEYPKDGIGDHIIHGTDSVNPDSVGTKAALHYAVTVAPGGTHEIRLRLNLNAPGAKDLAPADLKADFESTMTRRRAEADEYFDTLVPSGATAEEKMIVRQAVAGLMWGKQFFHFDVARWLQGDPVSEPPPDSRRYGRNSHWWHMNSCDVLSMPDPWEYPWYAAWDLAFHCVAIARVDPGFAKEQLLLLLREWYMHPNGQIPAYEWAFGDVNPPVHAWAALRVFVLDGSRDFDFLARVLHKLLLNFTWWVNRKDAEGNNVFEGGFLGLDNVGPFDRSAALPVGGRLEQSDGTAWMAMYALNLLDMSLTLAVHDRVYEDIAAKFLEHFAYIADAAYEFGLWDEEEAFFYDVLRTADGHQIPLKVRSVVGLLPLTATTIISSSTLRRLPDVAARLRWFLTNKPEYGDVVGAKKSRGGQQLRLLSMVGPDQLIRILQRMLDEEEFLSPYGLRTLSRAHKEEPFTVHLGDHEYTVGYEPGESTSGLFGGNSNWRGPIWLPVNYILIEAVRRFAEFFGDDLQVEYPAKSGRMATLATVADDLSRRLVKLFMNDADGRRPFFGDVELFQRPDGAWHDLLLFYEYFHGDTGAGLGAAHQTGWTALVLDLILTLRTPPPDPRP